MGTTTRRRRVVKGKKEIRISKEVLPSLPEEYTETRLGEPRGARRQFRNSSGVHVREYEDQYEVHVDRVDPRTDPIGHLLRDSPETLLSAAAGLLAARSLGGSSASQKRRSSGFSSGVLTFFLVFLSVGGLARLLKRLIFDWL
jgi:hypothetical protein